MARKSEATAAERVEAVLALLRREEKAAEIARRYDVCEQTLHRWRDQFIAGGKSGVARGSGDTDSRDREISRLEKDLAERDRVIGELTIANRVFKKVSGSQA